MLTEILFALTRSSFVGSFYYGYIAFKRRSIFGLLIAMNLMQLVGQLCLQFLNAYNLIVLDQSSNLMNYLLG